MTKTKTRKSTPAKAKRQMPTGEPPAKSKQGQLLKLLRSKSGVTSEAIQKRFGWQAHTARGVIATIRKRLGLEIKAERGDGVTTYRVTGEAK